MKCLALAIALSACASFDPEFPVNPGGGGQLPTSLSGTIGGTGRGSGGATPIIGRVCLALDPRVVDQCESSGAGNLTVTLGTSSATTSDNGSFTMTPPTGTNLVFEVTGAAIVPSSQAFSPGFQIPAIPSALFDQILAANSIVLPPGTGSILATVVLDNKPAFNVAGAVTPAAVAGPLYDGSSATSWNLRSTGNFGVVIFPGVPVGTASVSFFVLDATTTISTGINDVQVIDGGLTFVEAVLP